MMDRKEFVDMLQRCLPDGCEVISREEESDRVIFTRQGITYYAQPGTFPGMVEFTMVVNAYEPDDNLWFVMQSNFLNYMSAGAKIQVRPVQDEDQLFMLLECGFIVLVQDPDRLRDQVPAILERLKECADGCMAILEYQESIFDTLKRKDRRRFSDDMLLFDVHRWNSMTPDDLAAEEDMSEETDDCDEDDEDDYDFADDDDEYDDDDDLDDAFGEDEWIEEDEDEGDGRGGEDRSR